MHCVQRAVRCAENIQLCHHGGVLEIVTAFMNAVEEGTQRLVHVDGANVKMTRPFVSWTAAMVLQLQTNTVSECEQG